MAPEKAVAMHLADHEHDENGHQKGYIKGNDYALPYFSRWSRLANDDIKDGLLRHVNCGYLSTPGVPPTLLALKQHAQSLCVLIHSLNPTVNSAEIAAHGEADPTLAFQYQLNDAFDFLTDLGVPYANDDPLHNKPITALANEVRRRHEAYGTTYHCPFAESGPARAQGDKQKPYANHHALVMHANACLERLDHEFSSTGGLMSLLPTSAEHDTADLANARNSLLGQWLLFTQHLVARMHDLERSYGNALDALAGEAAIPYQSLAALGPDARSTGREIAFPQDRWVLVNAGDDVFAHVHDLLDQEEALLQAKQKIWRRSGAAGSHLDADAADVAQEYARGIVPVTVPTRFYRLAGRGRNTLFVLPAWGSHPGVAHTRRIEHEPTVVACPQPQFPSRASELEKRYQARIDRAAKSEIEVLRVQDEVEGLREEMEVLRAQNGVLAHARDGLMLAVGEDEARLAGRAHDERVRAERAEREVKEVERERDEAVGREERLREEVEGLRREVVELRARVERGVGRK